jgi:triacylglycerol lipase
MSGPQLNLDGGVDASTTDRDAMADGELDGGRQVDSGPADSGQARDSASPNIDGGSDGGQMDATARDASSTPEASVQDAAPASPFPRLSETPVIAMTGPYAVLSYSEALADPAFTNPIIYYPSNASAPLAAVVLMQGLTQSRSIPAFAAWGPFLASHGIVNLHVDTTSGGDGVPERADDIEAQVRMVVGEHTRAGSPLQGKLDPSRIGALGWSMGGGAALLAANRRPTLLRAVSAFEPWVPNSGVSNFPLVTAPTLVFAGASDGTAAAADHARPYYESLTAPKAYFELAGLGHTMPAADASKASRMILAWFKVYLESDDRYETYISGSRFQDVFSQISFFTSDR